MTGDLKHGSRAQVARRFAGARARRGVSMVWMLVSLVMVMSVVSAAVETSHLFLASQQLQNSADAAALAAARLIRQDPDAARDAAILVAEANRVSNGPVLLQRNDANDPNGDIVIGVFDRGTNTFTPAIQGTNAVLVRARRTAESDGGPVPMLLGATFGMTGVDVVRSTIAMSTAGGAGAGLITLGPTGCGASVVGNGKITVDGGAVQVNSASDCALCLTGNASVAADVVNLAGGYCGGPNTIVDGTLNTYAGAAADPLADLPTPPIGLPMSPPGVSASGNGTRNIEPGYYPGGIQVTGNAILNMAPGIYVIGSESSSGTVLRTSGNGQINANGVMIYVQSGSVDLAGNGAKTISPPDASLHGFIGADTYAGVSIFKARGNTATSNVVGNGALNVTGTVYMPDATLTFRGNGSGYGQQIIVDSVRLVGNGAVTINYNDAFPIGTGSIFIVR